MVFGEGRGLLVGRIREPGMSFPPFFRLLIGLPWLVILLSGCAGPTSEPEPEETLPANPLGMWYVQKIDDQWLAVGLEHRMDFCEDGVLQVSDTGSPNGRVIPYTIDEDRRVFLIEGFDDGAETPYVLDGDIMVLTMEGRRRGDFYPLTLCRRPEGNAEHQRGRAKANGRERDRGAAILEAIGEKPGEAGDEIQNNAE